MSKPNQWGADPELYKAMCEPHESVEAATAAGEAFALEVAGLRKKYRIPELCIQYDMLVVNAEDENKVYRMSGGAGWGDQTKQAALAKRMADREFDHMLKVISEMAAVIPRLAKNLITDPMKGSERANLPGDSEAI